MCPVPAISEGTTFEVIDALGRTFRKRALSGVEATGAYKAVWACSEDEWETARREGRSPEPEPFPWPLQSVRELTSV